MPLSRTRCATVAKAERPAESRVLSARSEDGSRYMAAASFESTAALVADSRSLRPVLAGAELLIVLATADINVPALRSRVRDLVLLARGADVATVGSVVPAIVGPMGATTSGIQLVIFGGGGFASRVAAGQGINDPMSVGKRLGRTLSGDIIDVSEASRRRAVILLDAGGKSTNILTTSARECAGDGVVVVGGATTGDESAGVRFVGHEAARTGPVGMAIDTTGLIASGVEHGWLGDGGPLFQAASSGPVVRWPDGLDGAGPVGAFVIGRMARRGLVGGSAGFDEVAALRTALPSSLPVGGFLTYGDVVRSSSTTGGHQLSLMVLAFT